MKNVTIIKHLRFKSNQKTMVKQCFLISFLVILLCQQCYANPIAMDFFGPVYGRSVVSDPVGVLFVDLMVDLSVLTVGFVLIRKVRCLKSARFLLYLILVVLGGLMIDEAAIFVKGLSHAPNQTDWLMMGSAGPISEGSLNELWGVSVFTFLLLAAFNYLLCLAFYRFSRKETATVAVLMGLLTHPDLYIAFSWMPIVWILLCLLLYAFAQRPIAISKTNNSK
jgi:hypothetical protein